jgi:hypothetical protein
MPRGGKRPGAGRKPAPVQRALAAPSPEVIKKVAEANITLERTLKELARIGYADLRQVVNWASRSTGVDVDEDTGEMQVRVSNEVTLVDSDQLSEDVAAAIAEVSQTKDGALKVKLHPKLPALAQLLKHLMAAQPAATDQPAQSAPARPAAPSRFAAPPPPKFTSH